MFLGGAGLADTMLYCRDKIYPLGLPNGLSHVITGAGACLPACCLRLKAQLPAAATRAARGLGARRRPELHGPLLAAGGDDAREAAAVGRARWPAARRAASWSRSRRRPGSVLRAFFAALAGKLGRSHVRGVHFEEADEISIEGDSSKRDPRRRDLPRRDRPADLPHARAAAVVRQARGLSASAMTALRDARRRGAGACRSTRGSPSSPRRSPPSTARRSRAVLFYGSCLRRTAARRADARFLPDRVATIARPTASAGWRVANRADPAQRLLLRARRAAPPNMRC